MAHVPGRMGMPVAHRPGRHGQAVARLAYDQGPSLIYLSTLDGHANRPKTQIAADHDHDDQKARRATHDF